MSEENLEDYRLDKPMDHLHQRLFDNNCPTMHELFNFPGKFQGRCPNKNANSDGSMAEVDISYLALLENNQQMIINVEDETSNVNEVTYKKIDKYRTNLKYSFGLPVMSIITTSLPSNKCLDEFMFSPTDILRPIIISYLSFDGEKILSRIKCKIENKEVLTILEFIWLIIVIRTFEENNFEILEIVCPLIKMAKAESLHFKMEMTFCSRYIIHKYAETVDDILRLEEVVGLKETLKFGDLEKEIENRGFVNGKAEGETVGSLSVLKELASDPDCRYTVEELSEKFGFTKEQIINENNMF